MRRLLEVPAIYQSFQALGGFVRTKRRLISEYLKLKAGDRIVDIGCGPGYVANLLPEGVIYDGFDTDQRYISYAQKNFADRGTFHCGTFDQALAREFSGAGTAMMLGLLHHLDDQSATDLLRTVRGVLRPGGTVLTLDGCFRHGQSRFVRWLLENDRGRHVRTKEGYERLCRPIFKDFQISIREDLSLLPYTFAIGSLHNT